MRAYTDSTPETREVIIINNINFYQNKTIDFVLSITSNLPFFPHGMMMMFKSEKTLDTVKVSLLYVVTLEKNVIVFALAATHLLNNYGGAGRYLN